MSHLPVSIDRETGRERDDDKIDFGTKYQISLESGIFYLSVIKIMKSCHIHLFHVDTTFYLFLLREEEAKADGILI
jgi:hypothetical protein